jgi:protein SCO1/2
MVQAEDGFLESIERTGHKPLAGDGSPATPSAHADFLIEGDSLPDADVVDQDGITRRLRPGRGTSLVMTFVYTRCPFPTFCPLMDRHFRSLQKTIQSDARLSGRVQLLSVTVDPAYDTPAVLRAHAAKLGADSKVWSFAAPASAPSSSDIPARFGVTATRDTPGSPLIVHNLVTVVVDPSGVVAKIFRGNDWKPVDIIDLLGSMSSPSRG